MGNFHLPGPVLTRMQIFTPKFMVVAHNFPVNLGSETTPSYSMLPTLVVPSFIGLLCQVCPPLLANLPPVRHQPFQATPSILQVTLSSVTLESELSRVESLGREASHEPRYHRIVPGPKAQAVWKVGSLG